MAAPSSPCEGVAARRRRSVVVVVVAMHSSVGQSGKCRWSARRTSHRDMDISRWRKPVDSGRVRAGPASSRAGEAPSSARRTSPAAARGRASRGLEPEARVIRRMAEQDDGRPAERDRLGDRGVHERTADAPALVVRGDRDRSEREDPADRAVVARRDRRRSSRSVRRSRHPASTATSASVGIQASSPRRSSTMRPSSVDGANAASTSDRIGDLVARLLGPDRDPPPGDVSPLRRPRAGRRASAGAPSRAGCTPRPSRASR